MTTHNFKLNITNDMIPRMIGKGGKVIFNEVVKKSFNELGWSPQIDFSEGLDDVIDWVNINWATIIKQPLVYIHKV